MKTNKTTIELIEELNSSFGKLRDEIIEGLKRDKVLDWIVKRISK